MITAERMMSRERKAVQLGNIHICSYKVLGFYLLVAVDCCFSFSKDKNDLPAAFLCLWLLQSEGM